jgi:hypothetical protein
MTSQSETLLTGAAASSLDGGVRVLALADRSPDGGDLDRSVRVAVGEVC